MLLVHGWEGSGADLVPVAESLVEAGYRAALVDLPAHGRSGGRRTSLVEWLRALRAVAGVVGPIHAAVGHSFGGAAVALALAEGDVEARGAVLIAPAVGPAEFVERFARTIGLPADRTAGMVRRLGARVGRDIASLDVRRAARAIALPALVLHDPLDREVPWEHARAIADAWTGSRLVARQGLGHRRILADAESIRAVVEFVAGLDAGGAAPPRLEDAVPESAAVQAPG
ncbi:MAG: alpha/beta hydrolase [Gemmatimonadaceae bacterium]